MVEQIFETACLIRGTMKRFRDIPQMAALREHGEDGEQTGQAWILAQYLRFMGHDKVAIVRAAGTNGAEHVWVEADGVTVDINADRLPGSQTLMVISEHSVFHSLFEGTKRTRVTPKALEAHPECVTAYRVLMERNPVLKNPQAQEARAS